MSTLQDLTDTLNAIADGVVRLGQEISDLSAQVAAGHVVSQEELDALEVKAKAISDSINAVP